LTPGRRIKLTSTTCRWLRQHEFRRRYRGVTPVGLRPPSATPRQQHRNINGQTFHLSKAKRCSEKPDHLCVYDVTANAGCVSLGISNDTAQFAVNSIRRWLDVMGRERYPDMNQLMITADGGGSNGSRVRLFKIERNSPGHPFSVEA
jgi:hypothetical protein